MRVTTEPHTHFFLIRNFVQFKPPRGTGPLGESVPSIWKDLPQPRVVREHPSKSESLQLEHYPYIWNHSEAHAPLLTITSNPKISRTVGGTLAEEVEAHRPLYASSPSSRHQLRPHQYDSSSPPSLSTPGKHPLMAVHGAQERTTRKRVPS